jgi:hypothetical protein
VTLAVVRSAGALSSNSYARRALLLRVLACAGVLLLAAVHTVAMLRLGAQPTLIAPLAVAIVVAVVLARPVAGLYFLLGGAVLFEQWGIAGVSPPTSALRFFENLTSYTDLPFRLSLADLLILLVLASWLLRRLTGAAEPVRGGPLGWAVLAYGAAFLLGLGIGIARGGSWNDLAALAELRAPVHLCALYFLTVNLVRTPAQASLVLRILVSLIAVKAVQGLWNFVELRDSGVAFEAVTSHEDVLFFNLVPILALASVVLQVRTPLARGLFLLLPLVLVVEALSQRRVGFVALGVGITIAFVLLLAERRRRTVQVLAVVALVLLAYGGVAWNAPGTIGQPLRALRGLVAPEDISERDRLSNYWRQIEDANISFTISQLPLTGVGLGQEYLFQQEPPPLDGFVYWRYMTHNAVYWLWLKAGVLGFLVLWVLVAQGILVGGALFRRLRPELKVLALLPVTLIAMQLIYSSVDLGLTYSRPMMVLGVALGLLAPLASEVAHEKRSRAGGLP